MENGEYQLEYIRETPEGYDEFAQRFEEYKKTHEQEEVSNTQIQGRFSGRNEGYHPAWRQCTG